MHSKWFRIALLAGIVVLVASSVLVGGTAACAGIAAGIEHTDRVFRLRGWALWPSRLAVKGFSMR
jgi:hypothetical protein